MHTVCAGCRLLPATCHMDFHSCVYRFSLICCAAAAISARWQSPATPTSQGRGQFPSPLPCLSSSSFGAAKSGCQLHDLWRVICVRMRKLRHNLFVQPDRVGNGNGDGAGGRCCFLLTNELPPWGKEELKSVSLAFFASWVTLRGSGSELSLPSTCLDWFIISLNYYQRGERRGNCHNSRAKLINNQNKSIHAPRAKMCQNVASCSSKLQLQHFRCSKRNVFNIFGLLFHTWFTFEIEKAPETENETRTETRTETETETEDRVS